MATSPRLSQTLSGISNIQLIGMKLGLRLLFGVLTVYDFRYCDYRAGERGKLAMIAFGTSNVNIVEQSAKRA